MSEIPEPLMLNRLRGKIVEKQPTRVVLDVSGIGFELQVPLSTSSRLVEKDGTAELLVELSITRAGIELFGFATAEELEVFRLLTAVKGVGPKAALNLLSRFEPGAVIAAIKRQDRQLLRSVPGIGEKKLTEILKLFADETPAEEKGFSPEIYQQAVSALTALGLSRKEANARLRAIGYTPGITLAELLKKALAQQTK
ncbi:MAG: Holliday junction branch migration protein RuvA [candidate division WOR-3 bacterium]